MFLSSVYVRQLHKRGMSDYNGILRSNRSGFGQAGPKRHQQNAIEMPIEFRCSNCSTLLRVPDESEGKKCQCPSCHTRLTITKPVELAASELILVKCPKCQHGLNCSPDLIGTRGCCTACAFVFTISTSNEEARPVSKIDSFAFACPHCKQLFEGNPANEGRKGKCSNCSEVFVIEKYLPPERPPSIPIAEVIPSRQVPSNPTTQTQPSTPKPSKRPPQPSPRNKTADDPFASDLSQLLPPPNFSAPSHYPPATSYQAPKAARKKKRKSGSSSGVFKILAIIGGVLGLGLVVCCGGALVLVAVATSKSTISAGGYSTQAPGRSSPTPKFPDVVESQGVINPLSRSEFGILLVKSKDPNIVLTPQMIVDRVRSQGALRSQEPKSRAGLNGIRYQAIRIPGVAAHTCEIYPVNNGLLFVMYMSGFELAAMKGSKYRNTKEWCDSQDNPEAFFESLTPASPN